MDFLAFWALLLIWAFGPSGRAVVGFLTFWACLYGLFGPSGRAAVGFLAFRACCLYGLLDLLGVCLYGFLGPSGRCCFYGLLPFTFALPFGQRFSIPLRAGDRWFRACGAKLAKLVSIRFHIRYFLDLPLSMCSYVKSFFMKKSIKVSSFGRT